MRAPHYAMAGGRNTPEKIRGVFVQGGTSTSLSFPVVVGYVSIHRSPLVGSVNNVRWICTESALIDPLRGSERGALYIYLPLTIPIRLRSVLGFTSHPMRSIRKARGLACRSRPNKRKVPPTHTYECCDVRHNRRGTIGRAISRRKNSISYGFIVARADPIQ